MSCNNYEYGVITLSPKDWTNFRRRVVDECNSYQLHLLDCARTAYRQIRQAGHRKKNFHQANYFKNAIAYTMSVDTAEVLFSMLFQREVGRKRRLVLPKKKDLRILSRRFTGRINFPSWAMEFDEHTHQFHWIVAEGDRAVERTLNHPVAQRVLHLLGCMRWSPGTGGTISGNDDYNRCAGSGSAYVVRKYGNDCD